jgi:hypothetical protein
LAPPDPQRPLAEEDVLVVMQKRHGPESAVGMPGPQDS